MSKREAGKGDHVKLIALPDREVERLKVGMVGEVIAYRITDHHVLVKWKGRRFPVSHRQEELEVIRYTDISPP